MSRQGRSAALVLWVSSPYNQVVEESFFFLYDAGIVNSYVMYGTKNSTGQKLSLVMFRIHLAKQLLELASTLSTLSSPPSRSLQHQPQQPLARLNERHFPGQNGKSQSGRQIQLCCAVCSSKKGRGKKQLHSTASNATCPCV